MKRRSWGVLAALVLTLLLLTTGALAAHTTTSHGLCTHGSSCNVCPADAKANAFGSAQALTVAADGLYAGSDVVQKGTYSDSTVYILPAGSYYLDAEITLGKPILIQSGTVNLCLNGHTLSIAIDYYNGLRNPIVVENGATFNLTDCQGTGRFDKNGDTQTGYIQVSDGGVFNMYNGTLNTGVSDYGTFTMYGGEISGNSGSGVIVGGGTSYIGTFTMKGGTIRNNSTITNGGGVRVQEGSTFTMEGGVIGGSGESDANSAGSGGGVYVREGTFNMNGGTISANTASGSGGGVYMYKGTFNMNGGTISGNTASSSGGGVYVSGGTFTMANGSITGNTATKYNGGGIYADYANLTISGGSITGNKAPNGNGGGVFADKRSFTMTGGTIGGTGTDDANTSVNGGGVYVTCSRDTTIVKMSGSAKIVGNTATARGGGAYVCGKSGPYSNYTSTFALSGNAKITGNTADASATGDNGAGGGVYIDEYGTFNMNGGEISSNTTDTTYGNGGGVCLYSGTFNMTDGAITGNTAGNGGGGIDAAAGTFTMTGGSITDNTASYGLGGGIHARIPLNMSGTPVIKDNKIGNDLNNVRLTDRNLIQLTAALGESAEIYVTPASAPTEGTPVVTIAEGEYGNYNAESSNTDKFHKDDADAEYEIAYIGADYYGSKIVMQLPAPHTHPICGASCTDGDHTGTDDVLTWTGVSSLSNDMGKGNYYLTTNVKLSTTWTPADGTVLDLNGHSITMQEEGAVINVTGSFTLTDCKGGVDTNPYGQITHKTGIKGSGVNVNTPGASFTMYGGNIYGNTSIGNGGGIWAGSQTVITMYGGTISGNTASSSGSSFGNGGGVFVNGTFNMTGGNIYGNTAPENGGGVCINSGGTFNMTKGMIGSTETGMGNSAKEGGGVCINRGATFTMASGSISGNKANGGNTYGGGVCIKSGGTFTMNSGSISGNETDSYGGYGGGVYVGGTFTMNSGTIGGETADQGNTAIQGGGVYIGSNSTFRMGGASGAAKIIGNKLYNSTNSKGGGVYVNGAFEIAGNVSIQNNTINNVYIPGGKTIKITGSLTGQKQIGITLASMPTMGPVTFAEGSSNPKLTENDAAAFYVDNHFDTGTYTVQLEDNRLLLYLGQPHKHTVCVGTGETGCSHTNVSFSALTYGYSDVLGKNALSYNGNFVTSSSGLYAIQSNAGNLYLTDDIRIDGTIQIAADVTLCLNGHSITSIKNNADVIQIAAGAKLTLCDCRGGDEAAKYGKITHHSTGRGRGVTLGDGSTFTMYGGSITGNTLIEQNAEGAGVYVAQNATFAMHGGSITSNTLSGQDAKGGGIFADAGSSLSVSGNVQVTSNGSSNLYLNHNEYGTNYSFVPITVTGELADTAKIGVTLVKSQCPANTTGRVNIAKATTEGWIKADNFVSDYNFYQMGVATLSNEQLAQLRLHDHTWGVRVKSAAEANILERYCTAFTNCPSTGGTLTLIADDTIFNDTSYAGTSVLADGWSISAADYTIFYTDAIGGSAIEAPIKAGTYYANVTVDGVTATKEFKISRYRLILNADDFFVEVPNNPTYDGQPKTVTKAEFKSDSIKQGFGEITVKYYDYDTNDPVDEPTNAGTYTVVLDVAAGDGYEAVNDIDGGWTFTVAQATQTLTVDMPNWSYGSTQQPTVTGLPMGVVPTYTYAASGSMNFTDTVPTVLGDYTVKVTYVTDNIIYTGTDDFSIVARNIDMDDIGVNWAEGADRLTYNGSEQKPDLSKLTVRDVTTGSGPVLTAGTDYDITCQMQKDSGEYKLTVNLKGNYSSTYGKEVTWYIDPLTAVLEWQNVTGRVYGDGLTVNTTVKNVCAGDTVTVTVAGGDQTEAGTNYTATATGLSNDNYALPTGVTQTYSIDKAPGSVNAPAGKTGLRYTGQAQELLATAATSATGSVEYKLDGGDWSTELPKATNAGTYTVYYRSTGDNNHYATNGTDSIKVTIGRKQIGIPAEDTTEFVYDNSEKTYNIPDSADYTVTGNKQTNANESGYTVTVTLNGASNTEWTDGTTGPKTYEFKISKKPIGIPAADTTEFVYDGSEKTYSIPASSDYTVEGDKQTLANESGYPVTVTLKDTNNTKWTDGTIAAKTYVFKISKKPIDIPAEDTTEFVYDGSEKTYSIPASADYKVEGNKQTAANEDGYTVTVTLNDTNNTEWTDGATDPKTYVFKISKKSIAIPPEDTTEFVYDGNEKTYNIPTSADYTVDGNVKTDVGTYTVTVKLTDTGNTKWTDGTTGQKTYEFKINLKLIDVPAEDTTEFVYDTTAKTYFIPDSEAYTVYDNVQTNANTYTVRVELKDKANTAWRGKGSSDDLKYTFVIKQAPVIVRALDRRITAGQAAPDLSQPAEGVDYTVSGLIGADTLGGTARMGYYQNGSSATPDTGKSGTYDIVISGLTNSNYDVQFVPGTLTIDPKPAQKLGIDAPGRTPGGSFELTPKNAKPGQTVTITVTPDEGYELGDLIVRDVGGENIPLTREDDGEFSFVMPKSSVSISVSFVREGDDGWFVDVPSGAYYYDAVKWAVEQGVTNGTDKTHYSPDGFCTRAQIVTFLWRAAGRPEPASMSSFVDVPADAYYAKAVAWAAELGIARGIDATHFDPDGICTRAHAVTFLARAAEAASGSGKTPFTDVSETAYYAPAVKWAAAGGVTAGVSATRFAPDRTCTRAQIVTFLYRFYTLA